MGHKPLHWDSADHLSASLDTYKILKSSTSFSALLINLLDVSWYYPPLVYWASIPFYAVAGPGEFAGFLEMTFFLTLLVVSVYQIGKRIYNPETGLFAAFCIGMFPITLQYGREYMLDLPLAAMCAAGVYSLIRTNDFSSRNNCIKFGVMFGLGMLTKWTFILFLAPPVIYYLSEGFRKSTKKYRIALNFFLTVLVSLIISLPWYLRNIVQILTNRLNELERGNLPVIENIFYYFTILPSQISYVIALLFIIAVIIFFKSNFAFHRKMPLAWFIGSYVLITIISFKMPRFSIPLLIPLSLLFSAVVFYGEQEARKRKLFALTFTVIAVINFFLFSFVKFPLIFDGYPEIKISWHNDEIIKLIQDDKSSEKKSKVNLRVFSREDNINPSTLAYYSNLNNAGINVLGKEGFPFFTDYYIEISRIRGGDEELTYPPAYNPVFKEMKTFESGNTFIVLYKKKQDFNYSVSYDSLEQKIIPSAINFFGRYISPWQKIDCKIITEDSSSIFKGKIKSLKISCKEGYASTKLFRAFQYIDSTDNISSTKPLPFGNFEFELNGVEFNLSSLIQSGKFEILSASQYKISSLELTNKNLEEFLFKKSAAPVVKINNNLIEIKNGDKFDEIAFLISEKNSVPVFKITNGKIFKIPLPSFLINYMFSKYNPVFKGMGTITDFRTGKLTFSQDKISIISTGD
jgi:hypothetical protein